MVLSSVTMMMMIPYYHYHHPGHSMVIEEVNKLCIQRSEEIIEQRNALPISKHEYDIMEAIKTSQVTFVIGMTGSGKTTQIPQYLLEAGYGIEGSKNPGKVIITQPRRIAATTVANRIQYELGGHCAITYRTRYDSRINPNSPIAVVTEGILLKDIISSPSLEEYSVVIIDEVHERTYTSDFLVSLLCRILQFRNNGQIVCPSLRLVLMSAFVPEPLLHFVGKFFNPAIIHVEGRQFPVQIHYSRTNNPDFVGRVVKKVKKIISRLPNGRILVFLPSKYDIFECRDLLSSVVDSKILCLYSSMDDKQQGISTHDINSKFDVILSTNVAETSITISDVSYVIDTGLVKRKVHDDESRSVSYTVDWISKVSALQRCGRAGRTRAGHCYRLYTAETFHGTFPEYEEPEFQRIALDSHLLLCLSLGIQNPMCFELPCMPVEAKWMSSWRRLKAMEIVDDSGNLSTLGQLISGFPLAPEFSVLIARYLLDHDDFSLADLCSLVLVAIVGSMESLLSDSFEHGVHYHRHFRSDMVLWASMVVRLKRNKLMDDNGLNLKIVREIERIFSDISALLMEFFSVQLLDIASIQFDVPVCTRIIQILSSCWSSKIAIRDTIQSSKKIRYVCPENGMDAYIHPSSALYAASPRVLLYTGLKVAVDGNRYFTSVTDLTHKMAIKI